MLGQSGNCFMCGVRLRVADALPALAIPIPDELRIARESIRRRQFCRIEISPIAVLATKSWDAAFSGNTRASENENPHGIRSATSGAFQLASLIDNLHRYWLPGGFSWTRRLV